VKKINFAVIASVLAIAAMIGGSRLRAHAGAAATSGISLPAGSFAGQDSANFGLCFNKTFTAVQACSTTPSSQVVPFINNHAGQYTVDSKGNTCGESIGPVAPLFPGPEPAGLDDDILVGVVTSYNPATGSGSATYKAYLAGPGVGCKGAVFVNTAKAPIIFTITEHFVVSQNGDRVDAVVLTIHTTSPVDYIAGLVGHSFVTRQTSQIDESRGSELYTCFHAISRPSISP
jgi:hypothetical protein